MRLVAVSAFLIRISLARKRPGPRATYTPELHSEMRPIMLYSLAICISTR